MLMILLSTLSVIMHLIFGNNESWLVRLKLAYETLCGLGQVDFNAGKIQVVSFDRSNSIMALLM